MDLGIFVSFSWFPGLTGHPSSTLWLLHFLHDWQQKGPPGACSSVSVWEKLQNCGFPSRELPHRGERKRYFPFPPCFFGIHGHWDLHHIFMMGWYLDAVAVSWQQRNLLCLDQPHLMGKAGYWVLSNSVFYWYYKQPTVLKANLSCGHFLMMEKLLEAFCIARVKISSETCDSPRFHSSI